MIGDSSSTKRKDSIYGGEVHITCQPGPQTTFLSSLADIAIYGGSAGGGKTFGLLLEASRHIDNPGFAAVIFRRTYPEVVTPGGLWPESFKIYSHLTPISPNESKLKWTFPSGATVRFAHMQHEKNVLNWLGSQICFIAFDQLETFTEQQFWYMLSRNRSTISIRPYIRATANPRPGWLAEFLAWWIDNATGYPIPERAGVLRWMARVADIVQWDESWEALHKRFPEAVCPPDVEPDGIVEVRARPKSVTFIPAKLTDNPILMRSDPEYLANLMALPRVERERLLSGNWLVGDGDGEWPSAFFGPDIWFDKWPTEMQVKVMSLDPSKGKLDKPGDYSSWIMMGVDRENVLWVDCDMDNKRVVEPPPNDPGCRSMSGDGVELYKHFRPHGVIVETNGFQEWCVQAIQRYAMSRSIPMPLYRINSKVNKQARIRTLTPYFAQQRFRVRNTPGGRLLVAQLRAFPDPAAHDDGPDSLKSAELLADWILSGRGNDNNAWGIEAVK